MKSINSSISKSLIVTLHITHLGREGLNAAQASAVGNINLCC